MYSHLQDNSCYAQEKYRHNTKIMQVQYIIYSVCKDYFRILICILSSNMSRLRSSNYQSPLRSYLHQICSGLKILQYSKHVLHTRFFSFVSLWFSCLTINILNSYMCIYICVCVRLSLRICTTTCSITLLLAVGFHIFPVLAAAHVHNCQTEDARLGYTPFPGTSNFPHQ